MSNDKLGDYKDPGSEDDVESCPGWRNDRCLNCDRFCGDHNGWACQYEDRNKSFDDLPWDRRYVTVGMRQSRGLQPKGAFAYKYGQVKIDPTKVDTSDWQTWAQVKPGNCACNIPQHQCKYHGNARV